MHIILSILYAYHLNLNINTYFYIVSDDLSKRIKRKRKMVKKSKNQTQNTLCRGMNRSVLEKLASQHSHLVICSSSIKNLEALMSQHTNSD